MKSIIIVAKSVENDDEWSRHERNKKLVWERLNNKTYNTFNPTEEETQEINRELVLKYGETVDQTHWVEMVSEEYFNEFGCPYY